MERTIPSSEWKRNFSKHTNRQRIHSKMKKKNHFRRIQILELGFLLFLEWKSTGWTNLHIHVYIIWRSLFVVSFMFSFVFFLSSSFSSRFPFSVASVYNIFSSFSLCVPSSSRSLFLSIFHCVLCLHNSPIRCVHYENKKKTGLCFLSLSSFTHKICTDVWVCEFVCGCGYRMHQTHK